MGTLAESIDRRRRAVSAEPAPQAQAYEAIIDTAPATTAEMVDVTVPGLDGGTYSRGPAPWMPRPGALPAVGDRALVVFDERGAPWVVAWWPEVGA